jgi:hypothetical protein
MRTADRGVVFLDVETTPFILRVIDAAAGIFQRYLAYRQWEADQQMLAGLGERELQDMGLYRTDLDRIMDGRGR